MELDTQFFLGANTPQGFASYYDEWLDLHKMNRVFLIKGTPGNGKSGFMRRVAGRLKERGYSCETILCSGDPKSWDGVYFPALGTAFADATSPHIMEPQYPLAVETYLPLTPFVDDAAISVKKDTVMRLQTELKQEYARLTRVLAAIRSLQDEQHAAILNSVSLDTIHRRTRGIIRREIKKGSGGILHKRFLNAISADGEVVLPDTVAAMADHIIELRDSYRQAQYMLTPVMTAALDAGQEVYACYDPYNHTARIKHLILPELRLAFVSADAKDTVPSLSEKRIRLDACIPPEIIKRHRLRLRFLRKTEAALKEDAFSIEAEISKKHDELEAVYNPHVDFTGLYSLADAYADKVLADFAKN